MTDVAILARASSLISLLLDNDLITDNALYYCASALSNFVIGYGYLSAVDLLIQPVIEAYSAIIDKGNELSTLTSSLVSDSVDALMSGRELHLAIYEKTSVVTTNLRYFVTVVYVIDIPKLVLMTPLSPQEVIQGVQPVKATLQSRSYSSYDIVRTTIAQSTLNLHGFITMTGSVKVQVHYDSFVPSAITISTLNSSHSRRLTGSTKSRDTTIVTTLLPNILSPGFTSVPVTNGSFRCVTAGSPYNVTANCSLNSFISLTCPGDVTGLLHFKCPGRKVVPQCVSWNGQQYISSTGCKLVENSQYHTTCQCNGSSGYDGQQLDYLSDSIIDEISVSPIITVTPFVQFVISHDIILRRPIRINWV